MRANELSAGLRARWDALHTSQPEFSSPFFSLLFTEFVGALREDVFVAVLEDNGEMGFFPFELNGARVGRPPGGRMCDYQGVVAPSGLHWTADELFRGCDLDRYHYKRLLASQEQFRRYHSACACSAILDLQQGFGTYSELLRAAGSQVIKKIAIARKKLERDHGPIRYEASCGDEKVFEWLVACKSAQYVRTGFEDQLKVPWITALLRRLHETANPAFGGMLSVLWAGEQIAAAHLGLRANHVLHYWFPCYSMALKDYSPGLILLTELARNANGCGISTIDLGRADAPYKRRFMSSGIAIAEGIMTVATRGSEREQAHCAHTSGVHS